MMNESIDVEDQGIMNINSHNAEDIIADDISDEDNASQDSDFSITITLAALPDVILENIMTFLDLKERYYMSVTCHRFYHLFSAPNLWKAARIHLMEAVRTGKPVTKSRWGMISIMNQTMSEIVKRFSQFFQHLYVTTPSVIRPFDEIMVNLLKDLSDGRCRLQTLSLEIGSLASKDRSLQYGEYWVFSDTRHIYLLTGLLSNAVCLKHLNIVSWPLYSSAFTKNNTNNDLFKAILSNPRLESLESISMFYIDKKKEWTPRVPILPLPEQMTELFSFLPNLSTIALRSPSLSEDAIRVLATNPKKSLKLLQVLILWCRPTSTDGGYEIPQISSEAWNLFKGSLEDVRVEFLVHIRIPFDEIVAILKPEVPLSSFTVLKYGYCDSNLIESICNKYADTITELTIYCDSNGCDAMLLQLVKKCTKLNTFVYYGDINYVIVMKIVDLIRNEKREMKRFELVEKNIKTNNWEDDVEEGGEEAVIVKDQITEEYVLRAVQSWHFDEDLHKQRLDEMVDYARDNLTDSDSFKLI